MACALLLGLAATHPASAQNGSYSGPNYSGGATNTTAYHSYNGGWGGESKSPPAASCSGPITASFPWNPGPANDPPPQSVIVTQTCTASGSGDATGNSRGSETAASSDGLGDTGVPHVTSFPPHEVTGSNCTRTLYTSQPGSAVITLTCSPSSSGTSPNGPVSANVTYTASVSPVTITLGGATPDSSGSYNILVGQGCTAKLNTSLPASNWHWSVSGTTFQDWEPTTPQIGTAPANPQASYYLGGSGVLTNATAHWYWNDPIVKPTPETISCTATVTPPAGQGSPFSVSATQKITVYVPAWTASGIGGYMQVNPDGAGLGKNPGLYAGPTGAMNENGQPGGINFDATSTTPALFGKGTIELVQIVTPNLSYVTNTTPPVSHPDPENGATGLDKHFPKGSAPVPYVEGGPHLKSNDSPGIDLVNSNAGSATEKHQFMDYLLYQPPGSDTRLVTLAQFSWSTDGSATIPNPLTITSWYNYRDANGYDSAGTVTPDVNTPFTSVYGPAFFVSWTRINTFPSF